MFPIKSHFVLPDIQVFGAHVGSVNGHTDANHRILNGSSGHTAAPESPENRELVDLRRKLATLPAIEQAKGMLMGYYGISADVAFEVLRRWSMRSNLKLNSLCATLVTEAGQPSELPYGSLRQALARWETAR